MQYFQTDDRLHCERRTYGRISCQEQASDASASDTAESQASRSGIWDDGDSHGPGCRHTSAISHTLPASGRSHTTQLLGNSSSPFAICQSPRRLCAKVSNARLCLVDSCTSTL